MYIKLGQHVGQLEYLLPPEYVQTLKVMTFAAPRDSFEQVERVFREEFPGKELADVFDSIDPVPIASASLAQVRRDSESLASRLPLDFLCLLAGVLLRLLLISDKRLCDYDGIAHTRVGARGLFIYIHSLLTFLSDRPRVGARGVLERKRCESGCESAARGTARDGRSGYSHCECVPLFLCSLAVIHCEWTPQFYLRTFTVSERERERESRMHPKCRSYLQ